MSADVDSPTELGYSSDLKEWFNQIIAQDGLPFSETKVERSREGKRADILLYGRDRKCNLIIEVKRPEENPIDPAVVKQASGYADRYTGSGLRYFATHNVKSIVLWDAVTKARVDEFAITFVRRLEEYEGKKNEIVESSRRFLRWYTRFLQGEAPKAIDEGIIETLHNQIQGIVDSTELVQRQVSAYVSDPRYRAKFDSWLLDKGWSDPRGDPKKLGDYCLILSKQFLYIFVNKVLFYHVLRTKYPKEIPEIALPSHPSSDSLHSLLETYFDGATKTSHDYETVFKTNFVDAIPLSPDTAEELVKLAGYLGTLDYSKIGYDITGKVFEKLIPPDDRHVLGQYFTPSDVTDLVLGFCLKDGNANLLDPACGSGTFLVRAYYRLKYLGEKKTHPELLQQVWGVDIDKFPAHLATINLAIRDLAERANYPNVVYRDFFDIPGPKTAVTIGVRPNLSAWLEPGQSDHGKTRVHVTGLDRNILQRDVPLMDCVVGNPPYTRQEELGDDVFGSGYKDRISKTVSADFPGLKLAKRSGIYAYFFPHGAKFLRNGGRLGFVCLRSWLDAKYGRTLEDFFLSHFKIVAVIESTVEKWFEDAQMLPVIVVLEACNSKSARWGNEVKFVQLKVPLSDIIPSISDDRNPVQEIHRWKQTDAFVASVESNEGLGKAELIPFLGSEVRLQEDERMRVVAVKQVDLEKDSKWGKFLTAPSAFFTALLSARGRLCRVADRADVSLGTKTGANGFFVLPNANFSLTDRGSVFSLVDEGTGLESLEIEKDYLRPAVVKIKPHKQIALSPTGVYLLDVKLTKSALRAAKSTVLRYIEYGEHHPILLKRGHDRGTTIEGYHQIRSVQGRSLWYNLGLETPPAIVFPSIFWGRYLAFWNEVGSFPTNAFFEIRPHSKDDNKVICALLNSSLSALFVEFSGRYIENRDKTISNQIMVFEVEGLPLLDPTKLSPRVKRRLEAELDRMMVLPVGNRSLFEPGEMTFRDELDKVVFQDILGLSHAEMDEIRSALASNARARVNRLNAETSEEDLDVEEGTE